MNGIIPIENITGLIYLIRGQKVMLDRDIAKLYGNEKAVQVNIQIMRAFMKMRQMIFDNAELRKQIDELRADTDGKFRIVFETLDPLLFIENKPKK